MVARFIVMSNKRCNVLLQGDRLYLKVLNTNMLNDFSYEIYQPMISLLNHFVQENIVTLPNDDLPTVVEPFGVQNSN